MKTNNSKSVGGLEAILPDQIILADGKTVIDLKLESQHSKLYKIINSFEKTALNIVNIGAGFSIGYANANGNSVTGATAMYGIPVLLRAASHSYIAFENELIAGFKDRENRIRKQKASFGKSFEESPQASEKLETYLAKQEIISGAGTGLYTGTKSFCFGYLMGQAVGRIL